MFNVPKHEEVVICLKEEIQVLDKICLGMSYIALLAVNSILMNQQSILNKVSLSRIIHRRRSCINQLIKMM